MYTQLWWLSPQTIAWRYSCYQAIKHTLILLPAATKHVTILLWPVLGGLSKYDRRLQLFSEVSALITGWLLALPHLYKCQSKVHHSLWKRVPWRKYTLCSLLGNRILLSWILAFEVTPTLLFFFFYFWQVMCAVITHAHYHVSLTVPGICTLISNILIAAGSYILLSIATINGLWNNKLAS